MSIQKIRLRRRLKMAVAAASTAYMLFGVTGYARSVTSASVPASDQEAVVQETSIQQPIVIFTDQEEKQINGFKEYRIPQEYSEYGGSLPVEIQEYIWKICQEYGVDYALVLAMIEVESGYHYDAESNCQAVGYMQVMESWHTDRMQKLGATDLKDPYQNILVGVDYIAELQNRYPASVALSAYNRGLNNQKGTGALDLVKREIYETKYSEKVLKRAAEIEKELAR